MNAEFNVWLLIVGLVVGAGLVWVVMMDGRRREADIDAIELPREAAWLSALLAEDGYDVSPEAAEQALLLHRAYLGAPPPDPVPEPAGSDYDSLPQEPPRTGAAEPAPATDQTGEPTADAERATVRTSVPTGDAERATVRTSVPPGDAEPAPDASGLRLDDG